MRRGGVVVPEVRFNGRAAAPGLFAGSVFILASHVGRREPSGDPAQEVTALQAAITAALAELTILAQDISGDGADMLAFQIAMLEDVELVTRAPVGISNGGPADAAWPAV